MGVGRGERERCKRECVCLVYVCECVSVCLSLFVRQSRSKARVNNDRACGHSNYSKTLPIIVNETATFNPSSHYSQSGISRGTKTQLCLNFPGHPVLKER